jgi:hypothetical protein
MANSEPDDVLAEFDEAGLEWIGAHMTELRQTVASRRFMYWSLGWGFALGLAAYVAGYLLRSAVTTEPLKLFADLLYALGIAMWTGVVVVFFAQVIPEAKERQITKALDAYEARLRDQGRAAGGEGSTRAGR